MNEALVVLEQVTIILILMFIGYISLKIKIMNIPWFEGIGKFTIFIALPALIFRTITTLGGRSAIMNSIPTVILSLVLIFLNFGVGKFVGTISGLNPSKDDRTNHATIKGNMGNIAIPVLPASPDRTLPKRATADTHLSATAMGNLGYIGIPMVSALYGKEGLLVLSVFMIFDVMLNWTVGINFMNQNKNQSLKELARSLVTPLNATLLVSVAFLMLNITPSGLVFDVISGLGSTTKYLSIIYLGAMLTTVNFKGAYRQLSLYMHTLVKLIAFPILIYMVGSNFVSPVVIKTFAIIMALPTMPSFPIFAKVKGGDEDYAIKITFVGTLTSLVTIPLVVWIMSSI